MPGRRDAVPSADDVSLPVFAAGSQFLQSFAAPGPLLVAISGGSDSTALLHVFADLLQKPEFSAFSLHAATVDHGLRPESSTEAAGVADLCARLGIPHRILVWHGQKPETGVQAAARAARYRLLAREAERIGASAILTGHTADDQRETVSMRAARGEGPGLAGMASAVLIAEKVWALRPLLALDRETLRSTLRQRGISWIDDPGNSNPRFERARMRLAGDAGTAGGMPATERLALAEAAADWLKCFCSVTLGAVARIDPRALTVRLDAGGALALFHLSGAVGGKIYRPARDARLRMLEWLATGEPGRRTLGGTVFDRRREGLFLYRELRGLVPVIAGPGDIVDGRYKVPEETGGRVRVGPLADAQSHVTAFLAGGVPEGVARRAAPAILEPEDVRSGVVLDRTIVAHCDFLSGFDQPMATVLRDLFGLPRLPGLPVRQ